jgi:hypothetical protein
VGSGFEKSGEGLGEVDESRCTAVLIRVIYSSSGFENCAMILVRLS